MFMVQSGNRIELLGQSLNSKLCSAENCLPGKLHKAWNHSPLSCDHGHKNSHWASPTTCGQGHGHKGKPHTAP